MAHHHTNKGLSIAFWLNTSFAFIELLGGIYTNSTAILTDAFHDLGDSLAIGTGIYLEKISLKSRNSTFSFGYKRFSLLSALVLSTFLLVGAILMLINAIEKLFNPSVVDSKGMFVLAIIGIIINGLAFWRVQKNEGHHHSHHHTGHSHSHTHSHNSQAIMLHLLEDVLGWVAILIGSIVIYFTHFYWIDPLLSIAIAIFIGYNAIGNLRGTMMIFLEAVPNSVPQEQLKNQILGIDGIKSLHDLHIWGLNESFNILTVHLVIDNTQAHNHSFLRQQVISVLSSHNVQHPTIQFENEGEICPWLHC